MLGGDAAALDVVGDDRWARPSPPASTSTTGTPACVSRSRSRAGTGSDMTRRPSARSRRVSDAEVLVAVHRRLDVEQHEVVAALVEDGDDAAQPLDRRRVGEEGDDHADRLAAPERQPPGERVGAVVEDLDGVRAPVPGSPSLTFGLPLSTRETVPSPTPACAATSAIVGIELPPESCDTLKRGSASTGWVRT